MFVIVKVYSFHCSRVKDMISWKIGFSFSLRKFSKDSNERSNVVVVQRLRKPRKTSCSLSTRKNHSHLTRHAKNQWRVKSADKIFRFTKLIDNQNTMAHWKDQETVFFLPRDTFTKFSDRRRIFFTSIQSALKRRFFIDLQRYANDFLWFSWASDSVRVARWKDFVFLVARRVCLLD